MESMFLDVVVTVDSIRPVFNGTRKDVVQWLRDNPQIDSWYRVIIGKNLEQMAVSKYMAKYGNGDPS